MKGKSKEGNLIEKLLALVGEKREIERISWDNLGKIVGYSGVGIKKALINNSLPQIQLMQIIVKLGLEKEANELGFKIENNNPLLNDESLVNLGLKGNVLKKEEDLDQLELLSLSNWDSLMKREGFKNKVENTAMKDVNKILDERLVMILKNLNLNKE